MGPAHGSKQEEDRQQAKKRPRRRREHSMKAKKQVDAGDRPSQRSQRDFLVI
jgi:hypothetical protein